MLTTTTTGGEGPKTATNPTQRAKEPKSLREAPRCQAKTKGGKSCGSPAVKGRRVCRMHGGKAGAPKGEKNGAYKHGGETQEARALRSQARHLLKELRNAA